SADPSAAALFLTGFALESAPFWATGSWLGCLAATFLAATFLVAFFLVAFFLVAFFLATFLAGLSSAVADSPACLVVFFATFLVVFLAAFLAVFFLAFFFDGPRARRSA